MKLKIEVTEDDINNGVKYHPCRCPIALAVIRALDVPVCDVEVENNIYISYLSKQFVYHDPTGEIQYFITAYDHDRLVVPFEFEAEFKLVENDND